LVIGKVPGLDTEKNSKRRAFDLRLTRSWLELFGREEMFSVLSIIIDDVCAERHFPPSLFD